ncbi:MAG: hypothetical protein LBK65_10645 [Tannerellaceae bacterium]|jgi:hypothetical protein|nr:hypothetical protein [Tannerellaceae bacterium]
MIEKFRQKNVCRVAVLILTAMCRAEGKTIFALAAAMLLSVGIISAQQKTVTVAEQFYSGLPDDVTGRIISSLDSLLSSIDRGELDTTLVDRDNYEFNKSFFAWLQGIEDKDTIRHYYQGQLINLYPVAPSQYALMIAWLNGNEPGGIFTFIAGEYDGKIVFASPIKYNTKAWKTATVGTITIHYPDTFNVSRAEKFHRKNVIMAGKLKLPVQSWEMYMCRHFQEVLQLQGCSYEVTSNGIFNSGYIVDPKTFFSVMSNEDFSHDLLHIYASMIHGRNRNVAECGLAYLWGNAGYVDGDGNIPEQQELIPVLQRYVRTHNDARLLDLFEKNPNVLAEYGYPKSIVYVKDIIAGLIWTEIEKQKGADGVIAFLKCGRGYDNMYKSAEALIGINRENFDEKVYGLLFRDVKR